LLQFFGNTHDHKATQLIPAYGLVNAAVILDGFAFIGSIPCVRIEDRRASPVGDDKFKPGFNRCLMRKPTFSKSLFWKPAGDQGCLIYKKAVGPANI
jgi:hypothetical protein